MAASSLRPQIVRVMAAHQERPLTTREIYEQVAASGVAGFDPTSKRDRNLVNRELSDLVGCSSDSHSKPSPQLLTRVGRGRYIFKELDRPMDDALVQEYLEPKEVTRSGHPAGGVRSLAAKTSPTRSVWPSTRCNGASARAAGYTCPTTCVSMWTTSWPWPTTE